MDDCTSEILDEISDSDMQSVMNDIMGNGTFDFCEYVGKIVNGEVPFSVQDIVNTIYNGIRDNFIHDRKIYVYIIIIAVMGAVIANFSKLLQGKKVSEMAFYSVYILFFSVLITSFNSFTAIAQDTLSNLFDFMKVLSPAYFMCMSFSTGSVAGSVYYQTTLVIITVVNCILLKIALPSIQVYFLLQLANQLSEDDMFSKLSELIHDIVSTLMKTMFGVVMGINVVQGLVVPITAQAKQSFIVKAGSAIPGIGSTISSVAGTVLCAGKLVKNAVGVTGIIALMIICAIPLLRLLLSRFMYQTVTVLIQPISDKRIIKCLGAVAETIRLQVYAVGVGCMMFVISIAIISAMS